jgi:release factor glutamine methyltransferase
MAYISGIKEFWSLELMVSPATLVPRPETELLVDLALREIPRKADWRILDLGTGSGAIALAIASERPLCDIAAVDVSADALAIATQNARNLNIPNVEFLEGNWAEPVRHRHFDMVVSNPPYVREDDPYLDSLVAEPESALVPGPGGLEAIETIARECASIIEPDGHLLIEHGSDQQEKVAGILSSYGWASIRCYDDYAGLPRVTGARFPSKERP